MDDSPGRGSRDGEEGAGRTPFSASARLLLWDYDRGSVPYDLLCLFLLVILLAVPYSWWRDPLVDRLSPPRAGRGAQKSPVPR